MWMFMHMCSSGQARPLANLVMKSPKQEERGKLPSSEGFI